MFGTLSCMILMELIRTDVVFSRIAMVLFLCRNKSSRNVLKIYGDFFWNKRKIPAQRSTVGVGPVGHKPTGHGHPLGRALRACGLHAPLPPLILAPVFFIYSTKILHKFSGQSVYFYFCTKNTIAILLKTASVRVSSIQIMQVRVQNKGKSVWKSRYDGDVSRCLCEKA